MKHKQLFFILCILLFISSCNFFSQDSTPQTTQEQKEIKYYFDHPGTLSKEELYKYPDWIEGCDRFRPIFLEELQKYPLLEEVFDLPMIYSLVYQESMCSTKEELYEIFIQRGIAHDPGWQGGIMQVDGCWRWDAPYDCENVQDQIREGMKQLNFSYAKIDTTINKFNLQNEFTAQQKLSLLFIAYNRGYYVIDDALEIYRKHKDSQSFIISQLTKQQDNQFQVYVECTEKDVCMNDTQFITITQEFNNMSNNLQKSLLISCRHNYGFMHNFQGDYCNSQGYGLLYPDDIFGIYDSITSHVQKVEQPTWKPTKEKEFYSKEIEFSDYKWFVKKSLMKRTPGPNYFYANENSVFVDNKGLHLSIQQKENNWYASEVVLGKSLGYGTYTFHISSDISDLHENLVFGIFTFDPYFSDEQNYYHREIDFEISRWAGETKTNAHFALQGTYPLTAIDPFTLNHQQESILSIHWTKQQVHFTLQKQDGQIIREWTYNQELVPNKGNERVRINLWMYKEKPPQKETEIIIQSFNFTPLEE